MGKVMLPPAPIAPDTESIGIAISPSIPGKGFASESLDLKQRDNYVAVDALIEREFK